MRAIVAAIAHATLLLTAPLWGQAASTGDVAEQIRKLQSGLANSKVVGDSQADLARRQKDFEQIEALVSAYLIAQIDSSPEIQGDDLRKRLAELLQIRRDERFPPAPNDLPFVLRTDPFPGQTGPSVFKVVYPGDAWHGWDGARVVVESYVLDHGKAKLAGRLGRELDGTGAGAQPLGLDELLIQGGVMWSSGANLPYKAALYRVNESGVSLVWQSGMLRGMTATVFGQYLLVNYVDEKAVPAGGAKGFIWALDVYSLDDGIPSLVFRRDHLEAFALR
jgi:hypothetical protein